ncbi:sugar phosphate isomerase/epimerase family protein [Ruania halotolerans]|uniref:sugar phosphate isomerase/epimerase family protein n=1 Tax=Ruania halotolerans TaxID=2897773 RepID=UPI001E4A9D17|nr:sugar phosphate isomerase/epimerase [Ruania halotolerans]UFU06838.1 sugar phosphate isomerase/epimerase [Ruania halotolerans]
MAEETMPEKPPTAPTHRIPVTLSSVSVYPRKTPYAFEIAAELGYDGLELMVWSDPTSQDLKHLRRLSSRYDLPIHSVHAPTILLSRRVWGPSPRDKLDRTADLAREIGASTVVVHPPFRWQYRYARGFAEHVREVNAEPDLTIAVENMYPWRGGNREMKAYLPGWDPTEHDYDQVTLDVSHAAVARQNSLDLLDLFGDRLAHVHLADGTASMMDEHLVPGRGDQPCADLLRELTRRKFAGDVVVEIQTRRARTAAERVADLQASLTFARTYLDPANREEYVPPPGPQHRHLDAW